MVKAIGEQDAVGQTGERVAERESSQMPLDALALDRVAHRPCERLSVDSALDQVVLCTGPDGMNPGLDIGVAGEDDHGNVGRELSQLPQPLESVGVRER
jgi:hypothetical protein